MASQPSPVADLRAPGLLSLADELLEEIFLRLSTPTDPARASTACGSFRRVITDRGFLRRFEAVHTPPFVGLVPEGQDGFYPAQPPYPSAPLARAVANAADFSYSFVPIGRWLKPWCPRDHRQGRVLLECLPKYDNRYDFDTVAVLMDLDLVVCDPFSLAPAVRAAPFRTTGDDSSARAHLVDFDAFLAPAGQDEGETSFKVKCTARNGTNMFAFVFSSVTGQWCIAACPSWSSLGTEAPGDDRELAYPDYACGCFYWTGHWVVGKLLVFDASKTEFSIVNSIPSSYLIEGSSESGIVAGAEGTPLKLFFGSHREDDSLDILHITKLNTSEPSDQQQMEKIIPLARQRMYSICGVAEGFLFLHGIPVPGGQPLARRRQHRNVLNREYFFLDVRTSELKKVCEMEHDLFRVHPFSGFAPSLLKPCV